MPRQYMCIITLSDEYSDETTTEEDLIALQKGNLSFEDLIDVTLDDPSCNVQYKVEDLNG